MTCRFCNLYLCIQLTLTVIYSNVIGHHILRFVLPIFSANLYIVPFITFLSEPADRKLTKELCDVIDDFSLVNFSTLDIQVCIERLLKI